MMGLAPHHYFFSFIATPKRVGGWGQKSRAAALPNLINVQL